MSTGSADVSSASRAAREDRADSEVRGPWVDAWLAAYTHDDALARLILALELGDRVAPVAVAAVRVWRDRCVAADADRNLFIPVETDGWHGHTLSRGEIGAEAVLARACDAVLLSPQNRRAQSLTGETAVLGAMQPHAGRLVLYASWAAWTQRLLDRIDEAVCEMETTACSRAFATHTLECNLIVGDPADFVWRPGEFGCCYPPETAEIVCADSRTLAQMIDAAMRKRGPKLPNVLGPKG